MRKPLAISRTTPENLARTLAVRHILAILDGSDPFRAAAMLACEYRAIGVRFPADTAADVARKAHAHAAMRSARMLRSLGVSHA